MSKTDIDLDAILEDAAKSVAPAPAPAAAPAKPVSKGPVDADVKPFIAATALVTKDAREKWTKMIKDDIEADFPSSFHVSYALRSWDHQTLPTKDGINRCLQEIVKKAAIQSGLNEATVSRLVTLVNPIADTEFGKQIQKSFGKQLLADFAEKIKTDPNFDAERFPNLSKSIA